MQDSKISVSGLNLFYGENHALKDINIKIRENTVMALIGPSGCGKSTFLKCLNRMNDLVDGVKVDGKVLLDGEDIYDPGVDTTLLRKKVGMVFQQPNPFPMSIYDNIAYGPRIHGIKNKSRLDEIVDIILETVCSSRKKIRIAGDDYPAELVKSKFMKLNSSHIEFVFDCLRENTTKIRNIRQYLRAVLFNAPSTIDSYYTALVAHDMAQPDWGKPKSSIPDYSYEGADSL